MLLLFMPTCENMIIMGTYPGPLLLWESKYSRAFVIPISTVKKGSFVALFFTWLNLLE